MNLLREFFLTRTTGGYMSVNGECFHNKGRSITEIRSVLPEVYIGSRFDSEQRNHIEKRLAPLKIPLSRMVLSDYSMTFKPGLKSATRSARV